MAASWSRPLAQLRMPSSTTALMIICHLDILSGREGIPRLHADGQESFLFFSSRPSLDPLRPVGEKLADEPLVFLPQLHTTSIKRLSRGCRTSGGEREKERCHTERSGRAG